MTSKLLVSIFISLGFASFSFAEETCITNMRDLAEKKDQFPKFLQEKGEIQLARANFPVAYFRFQVTDTQISGDAKYKTLWAIKGDRGYIKKLCYDKNTKVLDVTLDSGKNFQVTVSDERPETATVKISGYELTRNPTVFKSAMNILNGTSSSSSSDSSNSVYSNGGAQ